MLTSRITYRASLLCWGILLLLPVLLFSEGKFQKQWVQPISMNGQTKGSLLNIGNWAYWAEFNGLTAHDPYTGGGGGYFPKGKVPVVYRDGILWGALLRDPASGLVLSDTPRVGGIFYRIGVQPGWIENDGKPVDYMNQQVRIYRIRSDWQNLSENDLRMECAYLYNVDESAVTKEMMQAVRDQYGEDWKFWPVDLGAPYVDVNNNGVYDPVPDANGFPDARLGDYPGIAGADQVMWLVVNDLDSSRAYYLSGSPPIGIEERITLWAYGGAMNPLGNVVFKRIELINHSGYELDSMYVSVFADPDIGDYRDDLIGCDSVQSLAFAYNGSDEDAEFRKVNLKPAAVVYDLLQGPIVKTGNPQDTAVFDFKPRIGYKNLAMTSFGNLIALYENPPLGDISTTLSAYNMMRGFVPSTDIKHPEKQVFLSGPRAGQPTKFPLSGDPVTDPTAQFGDIDGQGGNLAPGDRQMFLNTGPFTMQPGERQEILVAVIGGLGPDRLKSLVRARETDALVKQTQANLFQSVPKPPAPPVVKGTSFDNMIVLNWGIDSNRVRETEQAEHDGYVFEGYNVYQLPDPHVALNDPRVQRIATFDRVDGVRYIMADVFSPEYGTFIHVPIQFGDDTGIKHHITLHKDYLTGRPFYRGFTYYFAVTAYSYNKDNKTYPSLESTPQVVAVAMENPKPGDRYGAKPEEAVEVHPSGNTDADCRVVVADPSQTTGHRYEVFFTMDRDTLSSTYGELVWNLRDITLDKVLLTKQKIFVPRDSAEISRFPSSYVDGLDIKVLEHKPGIKAIVEVSNGNGPLPKNQWDAAGVPFQGNNVWHSLSAPSDPNQYYISAGGGNGELKRIERSIANARGHDFEMRFTQRGGIYAWWYDADTAVTVPFEIWDVGRGTFDDHSDDLRCLTGGYSGGATVGQFDFAYTDHALGYPATDWIYARVPITSRGKWEVYYQDVMSGAFTYDWWTNSKEVLARIIICDYGGAGTLPETGTVIRFITYKGVTEDLTFRFTAPGRIENNLSLARKDVERINVFPNPYYGGIQRGPYGPLEGVMFNHLPRHAIIRIFTLNGGMVKKIEKNNDSQFYFWNLSNEAGLQIASGLYIVHIDMPELKKTKKLKLMVVMGE